MLLRPALCACAWNPRRRCDGIGIVDNAVADGVSQGGCTDFCVPATHVKLGAEDGGGLFVTVLSQLQQVVGLGFLEGIEQPFVQDEQLEHPALPHDFAVGALGTSHGQFRQLLWQPDIAHGVEPTAGGHAESVGQIGFSAAGGTQNDDVVMLVNEVADAQPGAEYRKRGSDAAEYHRGQIP